MAHFGPFLVKNGQILIFYRKSAWNIFYLYDHLTNCKSTEKNNDGHLRYRVADRRTEVILKVPHRVERPKMHKLPANSSVSSLVFQEKMVYVGGVLSHCVTVVIK